MALLGVRAATTGDYEGDQERQREQPAADANSGDRHDVTVHSLVGGGVNW
jgi:hypothetical protein